MEDYPRRISAANQQVQSAISNLKESGSRKVLNEAEAHLEEVLQEEELYWKQRSRELWLREGDRNSCWFHQRASYRRKTNQIWGLTGDQGVWQEDKSMVLQMVSTFLRIFFLRLIRVHGILSQLYRMLAHVLMKV